MIIGINWVVRH